MSALRVISGMGSGIQMTSADLSGANLRATNLSGTNLFNAQLVGANLSGAELRGTYLKKVLNLTPHQVKAAKSWEYAEYDPDFRRKKPTTRDNRRCWKH